MGKFRVKSRELIYAGVVVFAAVVLLRYCEQKKPTPLANRSSSPLFHPDQVNQIRFQMKVPALAREFHRKVDGWNEANAEGVQAFLSELADGPYGEKSADDFLPTAETAFTQIELLSNGVRWIGLWNKMEFVWVAGPAIRKVLLNPSKNLLAVFSSGEHTFQSRVIDICPHRVRRMTLKGTHPSGIEKQVLEYRNEGWTFSGQPLGSAGSSAVEKWMEKFCRSNRGTQISSQLSAAPHWIFSKTLAIQYEKTKGEASLRIDPQHQILEWESKIFFEPFLVDAIDELFSLHSSSEHRSGAPD